MSITPPKVGAAGTVQILNIDYQTDIAQLQDGLEILQFGKSISSTITAGPKKLGGYIGIAASDAGAELNSLAVALDSVTYTREERVAGRIFQPTAKFNVSGGLAPAETDKLLITTDLTWLGILERLTISGKSSLPSAIAAANRGQKLSDTIYIADATAGTLLITLATPFLENVSQKEADESPWITWSATLSKYTKAADPTGPIIIGSGADTDLDAFSLITAAQISASDYRQGRIEISLSAGEAEATRTETITVFDSTDIPVE